MGNSYYQLRQSAIMHRRIFNAPHSSVSREKNLVLILLAILVTLILWNSFWLLFRVAIFAVIVYVIYQLLRQHL
jgi:hypothetical protein